MRDIESKQAAQRNDQIAAVPSRHACRQAQQHAVNRRQAEPLLEQQIPHPERQHRAETVTDKLESFEKGHVKSSLVESDSR